MDMCTQIYILTDSYEYELRCIYVIYHMHTNDLGSARKITGGRMGISGSLSETEKNESKKRVVTRNRKIMGFGVRWTYAQVPALPPIVCDLK